MRTKIAASISAALLIFMSAPAQADAIDGNWCNRELGRLVIQGTEIMTPGGKRVSGAYDRHASRYVVPAGEPRSGADVDMVLVDDDTIHRIVAPGAGAKIEVWHRCQAPVS
jgi:hypothetical protein